MTFMIEKPPPDAPSIVDSHSLLSSEPPFSSPDDKSVEELARELKVIVREDRVRRVIWKHKYL